MTAVITGVRTLWHSLIMPASNVILLQPEKANSTGVPGDLQAARINSAPENCIHCGDRIPSARLRAESKEKSEFCCDGCAAVYSFLKERKLSRDYYSLRGSNRPTYKPKLESDENYRALDLPPFRKEITESATLDFFLEGIHCTACIWLLERLPEMSDGVVSARIDIARSLLKVRVSSAGRFEEVARLLLALGYRPHPIQGEAEAEARVQNEDRKTLRRIGVAAFAAMNVMIYSVSLYAGVGGRLGVLFRVLSLVVALPSLTYSAWPFYRSAWNALKLKRISIDLPIALAFIFGFIESLRQTLMGTNLLYLDSLTSLVFLMLLSRYALSRLERLELSRSGLLQVLLPAQVERSRGKGEWEFVSTDSIQVGEFFRMKAHSKIPADGIVRTGEGFLDLSVLTGESAPQAIQAGSQVFAGARVLSGIFEVEVTAKGRDTRVGAMQTKLELISAPKRNTRTERSDRWAQIFLAVVLGLAVVLLIAFGFDHAEEAFRRSFSLVIIACPCALALATPLTLARAYRLAADQGILLRDPEVLERLLRIRHVILDKTGTLTTGAARVRDWKWSDPKPEDRNQLESIAYSMESNSRHPYGMAISAFLQDRPGVKLLSDIQSHEEMGRGVRADYCGSTYWIGRDALGTIVLTRDGFRLSEIQIEDEIRPEARELVSRLLRRGLRLQVLSGDSFSNTEKICHLAGIDFYLGGLTPEQKREHLALNREPVLAVGDGVNDALMLKAADVAVAFNRGDGNSIESVLVGSDVACLRSDLKSVSDLFEVADRYRSTLTRNAVFSALYNLVGASFAVAGYIHPLVAAIAMPVSALTVFLSTTMGLRVKSERGGAK